MTRRSAIIACLCIFGAQPAAAKEPLTWLKIDIPETMPNLHETGNCRKVKGSDFVVQCEKILPEKFKVALEVTGDGRTVKFSTKELMDILEGKDENYYHPGS